ncbi:hypothetical protein ACFL0M_14780 [Thermodesulfobacteriota bacterium]
MANILTHDVRTYVSDLIAKAFGSSDKVDHTASKSSKTNNKSKSKEAKHPEQFSQSEDTPDE